MTSLSVPSADLYDAWLDCMRDFGEDLRAGSGDWQIPGLAADRASFDALLGFVTAQSDRTQEPADGHVHCDYFWVTQGVDMIGFVAVRHSLDNEFLRTKGGHIGYSIRPSYRRRGHASRALGLALARAGELGLAQVLITCEEDNLASARTIESQGGVFESVFDGMRRYWVTLGLVEPH